MATEHTMELITATLGLIVGLSFGLHAGLGLRPAKRRAHSAPVVIDVTGLALAVLPGLKHGLKKGLKYAALGFVGLSVAFVLLLILAMILV